MEALQLHYLSAADDGDGDTTLTVPDIRTALLVADINVQSGHAEIRRGKKLVARLEKHGHGLSPYWIVS